MFIFYTFQSIAPMTTTAITDRLVTTMPALVHKIHNVQAHKHVKMENVKKLLVIMLHVEQMHLVKYQTTKLLANVTLVTIL